MIIIQCCDRYGVPLGEIDRPTNVSRSFALNKSGTLTFDLSINHPKAIPDFIKKGNIVVCYSDETGTWSGYIVKVDWHGYTLSVTCWSIEQRLGERRTEPIKFKHAAYGEIFRYLINTANLKGPTGLQVGDVYMGGSRTELDIGAENIYQKLTDVCDKSTFEYEILMLQPGIWEMSLYQKRGSDLTDSLVFIVDFDTDGDTEYTEDWTTFANSILAVGKQPEEGQSRGGGDGNSPDDGWSTRPKALFTDLDSVGRYGLAEDILEVEDVSDVATLQERARQEVDKRKHPRRTLSFSLTQRRDLWGQFEEGDIVAVHVPNYGFSGLVVPFRVMGREITEASSTMRVAGEVLDGEQAQTLKMFSQTHYGSGGGTIPATG